MEETIHSRRRGFCDVTGRKAVKALCELLPQSVPYGMNIESLTGWSRAEIQDFTLGIEATTGADGTTPKIDRLVCPEPFAKLAVNFDGSTSVCCADWSHGTIVGNVTRESVSEIWNGERLLAFRVCHLSGRRAAIPACASCDYLRSFPAFADLDGRRDKLLEVFRPDGQHGNGAVTS